MGVETVITGAVSAIAAIIVCVINNHYQSSKTMALISYRLEQLEKKVDLHNNVVIRTYELEKRTDLQESEINRHKERLKILENDNK